MRKKSLILLSVFLVSSFVIALDVGGLLPVGSTIGSILSSLGLNAGANVNSPEFTTFNGLSEYGQGSTQKTNFDKTLQAEVLNESYPLIDGGLDQRTKTSTEIGNRTYFDFDTGASSEVYFLGADVYWNSFETSSRPTGEAKTIDQVVVPIKDPCESKQGCEEPPTTKTWVLYLQQDVLGVSLGTAKFSFDQVDFKTANTYLKSGGKKPILATPKQDPVAICRTCPKETSYIDSSGLVDDSVLVFRSDQGRLFRVVVDQFGLVLDITYDNVFYFSIDGDLDFARNAKMFKWPGNGTKVNPYIIENYDLQLSDLGGLNVQRTSVYFDVRNNNFQSLTGNADGFVFGSVTRAQVYANNFTGFIHGGLIEYSGGLLIQGEDGVRINPDTGVRLGDNLFSENKLQGLLVTESNQISSYGDTFTRNGASGLIFESSSLVSMQSGTFTSNGLLLSRYTNYITAGAGLVFASGSLSGSEFQSNYGNGVLVFGSSGSVADNDIYSNYANGIFVVSSEDVSISDNRVTFNYQVGVLLSSSIYISIQDNAIDDNGEEGVFLLHSSFSSVLRNSLLGNLNSFIFGDGKPAGQALTLRGGMFLDPSYFNEIAYNNISGYGYGIWVQRSDNNNIHDNNVFDNAADGIFVENSNFNSFRKNKFNGNSNPGSIFEILARSKPGSFELTLRGGMFLDPSIGNIIEDNEFSNNYGYGVYVQQSDGNSFDGNVINGNALEGLFVEDSDYNNFTNNELGYNSNPELQIEFLSLLKPEGVSLSIRGGMFLDPSSNNLVSGNVIHDNYGQGLWLQSSDNNVIDNNDISNSGLEGIFVENSDANLITNNVLTGNSNPEILAKFLSFGKPSGFTLSIRGGMFLDPSSGNTVSGNVIDGNYGYGLWVQESDGNTVDENRIGGNAYDGIFVENSDFNSFTNNVLNSNSDAKLQLKMINLMNQYKPNSASLTLRGGMFLDPSTGNTISGNTFTNSAGYGLWLQLSDNNFIDDNEITNNGLDGVFIEDSDSNTITNNEITGNANGEVLQTFLSFGKPEGYSLTIRGGMFLDPSFNNKISGNNISNNYGYGVYSLLSSDNELTDNVFRNNEGTGFLSIDSQNQIVALNSFVYNGEYGFFFDKFSKGTKVNGNDFIGNTPDDGDSQGYDDGSNSFLGNFLIDANPFKSYQFDGQGESADDEVSTQAFTDLSELNLDPIKVDPRFSKKHIKTIKIDHDELKDEDKHEDKKHYGKHHHKHVKKLKAKIYLSDEYSAYFVNESSMYAEWNGNTYPIIYFKVLKENKLMVAIDKDQLSHDILEEFGDDWYGAKKITINFFGMFGNFLDFYGSDDLLIKLKHDHHRNHEHSKKDKYNRDWGWGYDDDDDDDDQKSNKFRKDRRKREK